MLPPGSPGYHRRPRPCHPRTNELECASPPNSRSCNPYQVFLLRSEAALVVPESASAGQSRAAAHSALPDITRVTSHAHTHAHTSTSMVEVTASTPLVTYRPAVDSNSGHCKAWYPE